MILDPGLIRADRVALVRKLRGFPPLITAFLKKVL
jgi:hypothetical protein